MNISAINTAAPRTNVNFNGGMMDKMADGVAKGFSKLGNTDAFGKMMEKTVGSDKFTTHLSTASSAVTCGLYVYKALTDEKKTKNEKISESKREIQQLKHEADNEIRERKRAVQDAENKINQRESRLDNRSASLDKREDSLTLKEHKIDERKAEIEEQYNKAESIVHEQEKKLMEISNLSQEKARTIILERVCYKSHIAEHSYIFANLHCCSPHFR